MAFQDMASELMGHVPRIDFLLAQKLLNRAYKDVLEARTWSWLVKEGVFIAPQIVNSGTVTVTQFSTTVNLDATANAALNNLQNPLITQRQFRAGNAGAIYNIVGYNNGAATLTLDRVFVETSGTGVQYQVYRCYFSNPDPNNDFLMLKVVLNPTEGYAIVGPNLRMTKKELDARDPTRGAQDVSYLIATYQTDSNGLPLYEFWPHPTVGRGYQCLYQQRGKKLVNPGDTVALTLSEDLIVERALGYASDWAVKNVGRFAELKGVDWRLIKAESLRTYNKMLQDAKRNDDNLFLDNFLPSMRDYLQFPPIDSKFLQSHDWGALAWWQGQ